MPVRPLSPELAEKARVELNEDPKKLEDSLVHLKDWISKQPHLRARTDDQWLAAFLRGCKFSIERTKEKMDLYYTLRTTAPELSPLKHTDPKFMEILDLGFGLVLPKTADPASPRVIIMRPGVYDPSKYSMNEIMCVNFVIQQITSMDDDNFVVAGVINIMDLQGTTMAHFAQMTPTLMKKMSVAYQLYVHNTDFESLYKYVPKDVLPVEYGGKGGTIPELIDITKKSVMKYNAWLEEDWQYRTDESKRPGKPKSADDIFGVEGSFRQLQVD